MYLAKLGERSEAASILSRALAIDESHYEASHPVIAEDLENLASVSSPPQAAELHRRAALCSDSRIAARNLAKLAALEQGRGNAVEALALYRQALVKEEAGSGAAHARVAIRLNDVALLAETDIAEPLLRRALAIQQKTLGPTHPEAGVTANNLAKVLLARG